MPDSSSPSQSFVPSVGEGCLSRSSTRFNVELSHPECEFKSYSRSGFVTSYRFICWVIVWGSSERLSDVVSIPVSPEAFTSRSSGEILSLIGLIVIPPSGNCLRCVILPKLSSNTSLLITSPCLVRCCDYDMVLLAKGVSLLSGY